MRPKIICHMVSSVDGRLLADRWTPPARGIDPEIAHSTYESVATRFPSQGWIVGRKTMEAFADGTARRADRPPNVSLRETFVGNRNGRNLAVAIDPHGKLHYGTDNAGGDQIVAVLGERVSDEYLAELREDGIAYVFAGPEGNDLTQALTTLGDVFGTTLLLLEGGGMINGAFLKAGLIDEISLLIYPGIDGLAGVASVFEYIGRPDEKPADGRALRHLATETLEGGMVWLRYRFEDAPVLSPS